MSSASLYIERFSTLAQKSVARRHENLTKHLRRNGYFASPAKTHRINSVFGEETAFIPQACIIARENLNTGWSSGTQVSNVATYESLYYQTESRTINF